ncbi:MAG TPA: tRNA pseudouridine(38-40) synthase TruA [Acidobacteriaceae bacterium]|nr:tRNA pseudouridine(38-40) synthase TruA [Acidobacteriaceae bacterium]
MPASPNSPLCSQTIRLTLAYDGTGYHGWQVQPMLPSIQGELARALHHVTGETILPQASGRTDAGVHALGQIVSFSMQTPIPVENLHRALNRTLPAAIRVLAAQAVQNKFHARYDAVGKTYEYRIFTGEICPPTLVRYVWNCPWKLDLAALQLAAAPILGEHDFTSFTAVDPENHTETPERPTTAPPGNIRTIFESSWTADEEEILIYRIRGNGFLHHMVRNLVGSFVDAGCGRIAPDDIPRILTAKSRSAAGATAPASGLFLVSVEYPASVEGE